MWSLGVVLYICLCGFPPFSDELYSAQNPYTLAQQIKMGRFDYPSPYWDSVGDPALDLIDRMMTVDADKRITIDECLEHPWTTGRVGQDNTINPGASMESTEGLTGALGKLDFSTRKIHRERTLLSDLNQVELTKVIQPPKKDEPAIKLYKKNPEDKESDDKGSDAEKAALEISPAHGRDPDEFMQMGGKGDPPLFGNDSASNYQDKSMRAGAP